MTKIMYIKLILTLFILLVSKGSHATFSVVAVDPETREVGTAVATCLFKWDLSRFAKVVPNKGAVNTQSWLNFTNTANSVSHVQNNEPATDVIHWLSNHDAKNQPQRRQNLAITIDSEGGIDTAAYTGQASLGYKQHIIGDNYVIAGNILSGQVILDDMEQAFLNTEGDLSQKLMASLQAAKQIGADSRCKQTSSASAYLGVAKPGDKIATPFIHLVAKPNDRTIDPIDELQTLFSSFEQSQILVNRGNNKDSDLDGISDEIEFPRLVDYPIETNGYTYSTGDNLYINGGRHHRVDVSAEKMSNLVLTLVAGPDMYQLTPGQYIGFSFIDDKDKKVTVKSAVIGQSAFAKPGSNVTGALTAVGKDQNNREVALLVLFDPTFSPSYFYASDAEVPSSANNRDVELPGRLYYQIPPDSDGDGKPDYLDNDSDNDGIPDQVEFPGLVDFPIKTNGYTYATGNNLFINDGKNHRINVSADMTSDLVIRLTAGLDMYKLTPGKHIGFTFNDEYGESVTVNDAIVGQSAFAKPGPNVTGAITAVGHDQNGRLVALLMLLDPSFSPSYFYASDVDVPLNANNRDVELPGMAYEPLSLADKDEDGIADYLDTDSDNDGMTDDEEDSAFVTYPIRSKGYTYATGYNLFTDGGRSHQVNTSADNVSELQLILTAGLDMYKLTPGKQIGFSFSDEKGAKITVESAAIGQSAFSKRGPNVTGALTAVGYDKNDREVGLLILFDPTFSPSYFYATDADVPSNANNRDVELPGTPYVPVTY